MTEAMTPAERTAQEVNIVARFAVGMIAAAHLIREALVQEGMASNGPPENAMALRVLDAFLANADPNADFRPVGA